MEEPESGHRIDVWIGNGTNTRKKFEAWYDPTRKGYVVENLFALDLRLPPYYTTGPERLGGCTIARFDHASPPYGPQCTLAVEHDGEHRFPSSREPVEDDNSEILS